MRLERVTLSDWRELLPSQNFEVFHTPAALEVIDEHADGNLHLYAGFRGQEPVGLMPVVIRKAPLGSIALSPPPGMAVPRLGPLLLPSSPKRRKREKLNREFTELVFDEVNIEDKRTLFRAVCPPVHEDPRPFVWRNLELDTAFTYHLNITERSADELLASASKSLRREVNEADKIDVTIQREDLSRVVDVFEETKHRYRQQDRPFPLPWEYVQDLVSALDREDRCRVYNARAQDGGFLSGIIVLYSNDMAYYWLGGTRSSYKGVSINSAIHWQIIEDLIEDPPHESIHIYDLMGANTERLCRYKSKFGAELVPYYVVESSGIHMDIAKKAYRLVAR